MIASPVFLSFFCAFVLTSLLPVALCIWLGVRKKLEAAPFFAGVLAFFLSQMVLRIPLLNLLASQAWYIRFAGNTLLFTGFLSLTAGLFEESARLAGALVLKKNRAYRDAVSFGLGHGLCETVLLVGTGHLNNLLFCFLLSSGGMEALSKLLTPAMAEAVAAQLAAVPVGTIWAGLLERVSAVLFHLFATMLVFHGVRAGKAARYYLLAIAAHTVFNLAGVLSARAWGVWPSEALLLALALAGGWYVLRQRAWYDAN